MNVVPSPTRGLGYILPAIHKATDVCQPLVSKCSVVEWQAEDQRHAETLIEGGGER